MRDVYRYGIMINGKVLHSEWFDDPRIPQIIKKRVAYQLQSDSDYIDVAEVNEVIFFKKASFDSIWIEHIQKEPISIKDSWINTFLNR